MPLETSLKQEAANTDGDNGHVNIVVVIVAAAGGVVALMVAWYCSASCRTGRRPTAFTSHVQVVSSVDDRFEMASSISSHDSTDSKAEDMELNVQAVPTTSAAIRVAP